MKIFLGICLSKKNEKFLYKLTHSLINLEIPKNYFLKIIFITEKKNLNKSNLHLQRLVNKKFEIIFTKYSGIPQARNVFLNYVRKNDSKYAGFLDDDCVIPNNWLKDMLKFIIKTKCDVVGGPQFHKTKNRFFIKLFRLIEPNRYHFQKVDWVATNNAFFRSNILKKNLIKFDKNLKNIGGSDQLFFKELNRKKVDCRWNAKSYVIENIQTNRENIKWFLKRNLRYGYSGNYIDKKVYGKIIGTLLCIWKIAIMLLASIIYFSLFFFQNNFYKSIFYFSRSFGRLLGIFNYTPKKYT
jgi:hypothetical protein